MNNQNNNNHNSQEGLFYIISGPSGVGKTSLVMALTDPDNPFVNHLITPSIMDLNKNQNNLGLKKITTHTTRHVRDGETNGIDYHFTDNSSFESMINNGELLEYAKVFDCYYGTSKKEINNILKQGYNACGILDWQGHHNVKQTYNGSTCSIFINPPDLYTLEKRLINRNQDSMDKIHKRIAQAEQDMEQAQYYDYVVVNNNFEHCVKSIASIMMQLKNSNKNDEKNSIKKNNEDYKNKKNKLK